MRVSLRPFDLALTAIVAALNFIVSLTVAPTLNLFIPTSSQAPSSWSPSTYSYRTPSGAP